MTNDIGPFQQAGSGKVVSIIQSCTDGPKGFQSILAVSPVSGLLALLLIVGCSGSDGLIEINGQVLYDGQSVQNGFIAFIPADGRGPAAETVVRKGRYRVDVAPGSKKVVIEGHEKTGEKHVGGPETPLVPINRQYLPERYSDRRDSELTCDISSAKVVYDFDLKK